MLQERMQTSGTALQAAMRTDGSWWMLCDDMLDRETQGFYTLSLTTTDQALPEECRQVITQISALNPNKDFQNSTK